MNELYEHHRGQGTATPRTLWERINHQNGLLKQFDRLLSSSCRVVYNKSGQILRGYRTKGDAIIENALYYGTATFEEAGYLTCMLNAPCLQLAYQESRESDRHFDLHPLRKVPIPRFDPADTDHLELVELCELAEVAAKEVIDGLADNTGQIKASNLIRQMLMDEGNRGRHRRIRTPGAALTFHQGLHDVVPAPLASSIPSRPLTCHHPPNTNEDAPSGWRGVWFFRG